MTGAAVGAGLLTALVVFRKHSPRARGLTVGLATGAALGGAWERCNELHRIAARLTSDEARALVNESAALAPTR